MCYQLLLSHNLYIIIIIISGSIKNLIIIIINPTYVLA